MKQRTLVILLGCGILAVAGGWFLGTATTPAGKRSAGLGKLAFPDLGARLGDAAKLEITHQGAQTSIEKRPDGAWGVAAMHAYPAQPAKIRGTLIELTELRLREPRTSDPAVFGRLGVEDPNASDASSDLVQVLDRSGRCLAAVIVGHRIVRSRGDFDDEVYVRFPDGNQSWLADGNLRVDADPSLWLDRSLMNIGHDRIASVVVGDRALMFRRSDGRLALTEPGEHPKLQDYKVNGVARALEMLSFQQVREDKAAPGAESGHAVFTTGDGLAISVTTLHADKAIWARFRAAGSGASQPEADKLNARLAGWVFEIGAWKEQSLVPAMADLAGGTDASATPAAAGAEPDAAPGDPPLPRRTQ